jgi:DNA-binding MarR family transcriptional regulator
LRTLDQQKMISYSSPDEISILSPAGRVLVAIMEDPSITQRALSVYLGVTESNVQKAIRILVNSGLVKKTKVRGRNIYSVSEKALSHSDICRFFDGIQKTRNIINQDVEPESSPF